MNEFFSKYKLWILGIVILIIVIIFIYNYGKKSGELKAPLATVLNPYSITPYRVQTTS